MYGHYLYYDSIINYLLCMDMYGNISLLYYILFYLYIYIVGQITITKKKTQNMFFDGESYGLS